MGAGRALEMVPADEIMSAFELVPVDEQSLRQPGLGPADYWLPKAADQVLGVIAATTRNFCASCNRIRLTATGAVGPCLASAVGTELGPILRDVDADDRDLVEAIYQALAIKPEGHRFSEGIAGELPMADRRLSSARHMVR